MSLRIAEKHSSLQTIRQYQSEIAEIREGPAPKGAQFTLHAIGIFFIGAVLILTFGQTDRVVSSSDGLVVSVEPPIVVQAFDQGVIRSIDVKPGQEVKKGQVLGSMDPTFTQALVDQYRAQADAYIAQIARDEAEIQQKPLVFPVLDDPQFAHYVQINRDLYTQQMANYQAQLSSYDQQIALTETTIQKFKNDQSRYKERVDIQNQIEGMYSTLHEHGTGSLLNALTSSDNRIDTARNMEFDRNTAEENSHQLSEQKATREAYVQQFLATTSQDLATARINYDNAKAQLDSAIKHRDLVKFYAPEDAEVTTIANLSVGSVLQPGNSLFTLTPLRVPLEVELKLNTSRIGYIRVGDPVEIKIDSFAWMEHGYAEGTVRWISENIYNANAPTLTDSSTVQTVLASNSGAPLTAYYKVRVSIDKLNFRAMPPTFRLTPGMTLEGDIKVGTHSIGAWVLGAVTQGATESLRAP